MKVGEKDGCLHSAIKWAKPSEASYDGTNCQQYIVDEIDQTAQIKSPVTSATHGEFREYFKKYPKGFVHFLVSGHGGLLDDGTYSILKEGSKQAIVDGKVVYEGVLNRKVRDYVLENNSLTAQIIDLVPSANDMTLRDRVHHANSMHDAYVQRGYLPIIWEIHHNAFNGSATGTEVFTTRKNNLSDSIATIWMHEAKKFIGKDAPDWKWREDNSDGDPDKEKDFYLLKRAKSFGILMEMFFFDSKRDMATFGNPEGQWRWAQTIVRSMKTLENIYNKNKPSLFI